MSLGTVAFVVVVLELVAAGAAVFAARRFWRQIEPQIRPLLAMFAPPAPPTVVERIEESTGSSSSASGE